MTANETLKHRVRAALADKGSVQEKKMFGGITFMANGKMCISVGKNRLMCRIDPKLHDELMQKEGCRTVTMKGREYKGYVWIDDQAIRTEQEFCYWISLALEYNTKAKASKGRKTNVGKRSKSSTILLAAFFGITAALVTRSSAASLLKVEPADALWDQSVSITMRDLEPRQRITLIATAKSADGSVWRAEDVFAAGDHGDLDLSRDQPLKGSYNGVDPMGLLCSIQPPAETEALFAAPPGLKPLEIKLIAKTADGKQIGEAALTRRQIAASGVAQKAMKDGPLIGALFFPDDKKKHPAILLLGGSEGGYEEDAFPAVLASHGFAVLSLAYFGIEPLPKSLVAVPVETAERGIDYLLQQPFVAREAGIGIIGSSRGAELAIIVATLRREAKAVVAIVPTSIVFAGLKFGRGPVDESPWTIGGKPVPYITFDAWTKYLATKDVTLIQQAIVPVENINAPILFVAGGEDHLGLSGVMSKMAMERLAEKKHSFADQLLDYSAAGHLILFPPYQPTANTTRLETGYGTLDFGGSPEANATAAADAWPKMLEFIQRALRK